jgi:hypothetical protein
VMVGVSVAVTATDTPRATGRERVSLQEERSW